MPGIGRGCHERRIVDEDVTWRIIYAVEPEAIAILEVFKKKTRRTPARVIRACRARLRDFGVLRNEPTDG